VYIDQTPAGTSTQNMLHFVQGIIGEQDYKYFDFGSVAENTAKYGQATPPSYDLGKYNVPTAFFSGSHDYMADPKDVAWTIAQIDNKYIVYQDIQKSYAHLDFVWSPLCKDDIYGKVKSLLQEASQ
tara:strand:- start:43 stop:420 length:378 start_codon:yes stop_codon:yes gene_type:complete